MLRNIITLFLFTSAFYALGQSTYSNLKKVSSFEALDYSFQTYKVALQNDITIAYFDEGNTPDKETIVFIHGLGSYAPAWQKNIRTLSQKYRCIAIDLPGYGKSSKADYKISLLFYAQIISEFADSLNLGTIHLAGHSMGGQIAMVTALTYPTKIKSLLLIAPAGIETFTEGEKEWFRTAVSAKGVMLTPLDQIEKNIGHNFYKMPKEASFMISDRYAMTGAGDEFLWYCNAIPKCISAMVDQPVIRDLPSISHPTLIVMGKADQLIPNRFLHGGSAQKIAKKGGQLIPNSQVEVLPKAGHFVMYEKSEEVNRLIEAFLQKN
jgi:pimeloyl-ACP methyl ester carboxylesterase